MSSANTREALLEDLRKLEEIEDAALIKVGKRNLHNMKFYPKQLEFLRSSQRIRIFSGGNASGKSLVGASETCYFFLKNHPFKSWVSEYVGPIHILIVVKNYKQQTLPGGAQNKLLEQLPEKSIKNIQYHPSEGQAIQQITGMDGSTIIFRSQASAVSSFSGARFNFIWGDEEIDNPELYNELVTRLPSIPKESASHPYLSQLYLYFTMTPNLSGDYTFFQDHVYPKCFDPNIKDYEIWEASIQDNHFLPTKIREQMMESLIVTNEQEVAGRIYGTSIVNSHRVYPTFNKNTHIIPPLNIEAILKGKIFRIIDPHDVKPSAVLFISMFPNGQIIIFKELSLSGITSQNAKKILEHSEPFKSNIVETIIDWSGNRISPSNGLSVVQELRDHGVPTINCRKQNKSEGIHSVFTLLHYNFETQQVPRLTVTSDCPLTINEFLKYRYTKSKSEVVKKSDEYMDCLRYFCCSINAGRLIANINIDLLPKSINNTDALSERNLKYKGARSYRAQQVMALNERCSMNYY